MKISKHKNQFSPGYGGRHTISVHNDNDVEGTEEETEDTQEKQMEEQEHDRDQTINGDEVDIEESQNFCKEHNLQ